MHKKRRKSNKEKTNIPHHHLEYSNYFSTSQKPLHLYNITIYSIINVVYNILYIKYFVIRFGGYGITIDLTVTCTSDWLLDSAP